MKNDKASVGPLKPDFAPGISSKRTDAARMARRSAGKCMKRVLLLIGAKRREWMDCWGNGMILTSDEMDHCRKFPAFSTSKSSEASASRFCGAMIPAPSRLPTRNAIWGASVLTRSRPRRRNFHVAKTVEEATPFPKKETYPHQVKHIFWHDTR